MSVRQLLQIPPGLGGGSWGSAGLQRRHVQQHQGGGVTREAGCLGMRGDQQEKGDEVAGLPPGLLDPGLLIQLVTHPRLWRGERDRW